VSFTGVGDTVWKERAGCCTLEQLAAQELDVRDVQSLACTVEPLQEPLQVEFDEVKDLPYQQ
jgi:hypothetical protein